MKWLLVAALLGAACQSEHAAADANGDAAAIDAKPIEPGDNTFTVPIGAACNEQPSLNCDYGFGVCDGGICRPRCVDGQYPKCDAGYAEHYRTIDGAAVCSCVPQ